MKDSPRTEGLAIGLAMAASALAVGLRILGPRLAAAGLARWSYSPASLPFSLRFALSRGASAFVYGGCALVLALALVAYVVLRRRRLARALFAVQVSFAVGVTGVTASGLNTAMSSCAFTVAQDLECCRCPASEGSTRSAIECHCSVEGWVRETITPLRSLEGGELAARLRGEGRTVRAKSTPDGLAFSIDGSSSPPVHCRYVSPCRSQFDACGRCELEAREPVAVEVDSRLSCIDAKVGQGALSGFMHLRRTVWADEIGSGPIPFELDRAKAVPTQLTELIGSETALRGVDDRYAAAAILGRDALPPIQRGGVRFCRVANDVSPKLTGQLDEPLATRFAIVRLEALAE